MLCKLNFCRSTEVLEARRLAQYVSVTLASADCGTVKIWFYIIKTVHCQAKPSFRVAELEWGLKKCDVAPLQVRSSGASPSENFCKLTLKPVRLGDYWQAREETVFSVYYINLHLSDIVTTVAGHLTKFTFSMLHSSHQKFTIIQQRQRQISVSQTTVGKDEL